MVCPRWKPSHQKQRTHRTRYNASRGEANQRSKLAKVQTGKERKQNDSNECPDDRRQQVSQCLRAETATPDEPAAEKHDKDSDGKNLAGVVSGIVVSGQRKERDEDKSGGNGSEDAAEEEPSGISCQ